MIGERIDAGYTATNISNNHSLGFATVKEATLKVTVD
jgi:hypothetical protein